MTKNGERPFFAFQSESWKRVIKRNITLTRVFRQKDERKLTFAEVRRGLAAGRAAMGRPVCPADLPLVSISLHCLDG